MKAGMHLMAPPEMLRMAAEGLELAHSDRMCCREHRRELFVVSMQTVLAVGEFLTWTLETANDTTPPPPELLTRLEMGFKGLAEYVEIEDPEPEPEFLS